MSASVADTRVDLVSNSTFDVPLVILAESDVLDRSIFPVRPPNNKCVTEAVCLQSDGFSMIPDRGRSQCDPKRQT